MSLVTPGTRPFHDIHLYATVQVAVTCAALYDHVLSFSREVELIWMKPMTLVTVLYVIDRYLGDMVLIVGLCLCVVEVESKEEYVDALEVMETAPDLRGVFSRLGLRLFAFRAWGALVYSWATQATMQVRIYAMYKRSRSILILLLMMFICQIAAITSIILWSIGPQSGLHAWILADRFCVFLGINGNFVYIFIPFSLFEFLLFVLAARIFVENMKHNRPCEEKGFGLNSFMRVLARDSICYFFVNLVACAVVTGLWQSVDPLYANICVPIVMLLEVLVGTRLILGLRERYARPDGDPIVSGRQNSSVQFKGNDYLRTDDTHVHCEVEMTVVTHVEVT